MEKQRLDKIIASTGKWSRREVKALIRQGLVLVEGGPRRRPDRGEGGAHRLPPLYLAHAQ